MFKRIVLGLGTAAALALAAIPATTGSAEAKVVVKVGGHHWHGHKWHGHPRVVVRPGWGYYPYGYYPYGYYYGPHCVVKTKFHHHKWVKVRSCY